MEINNIASHQGIVTATRRGTVSVQIESVSACASCQAHGRCGFAESKNKTIEVPASDWQQYRVGDAAIVRVDERHGLLAVWIAYVLPALLMLGLIVGLSLAGVKEIVVILSAFLLLALYVAALYLFRGRVGSRFTLTVSKC